MTTAGFVLYGAYLLSGLANEWSLRLLGGKAYISTVAVALLPVAWLMSGNITRSMRHPLGRCWMLFLLWLVLATPFSVWRGGSAALLWSWVPKNFLCYFYACAFATSMARCRQLMYVNIAGAWWLLLTCIAFGAAPAQAGETRFHIPNSLFYDNANDLALALLMGMASLFHLFWKRGVLKRLIAGSGVLLCAIYSLKTASRGGLIAGASLLGLGLFLGRVRWKALVLGVPVLGVALAALPASTLHRLSLVAPGADIVTSADRSSAASQAERAELFHKSLDYTLMHPLLGVGPGQFSTAVHLEAAEAGRHVPWLGTHNTYTEISSEAGIPALILHCAIVVLCLRANYRVHQRARRDGSMGETAGLSFCLLASSVVYAVSTFFFHIAYSVTLPALAGFTAALESAAADGDRPAPPPLY